jgi:hypothetical protein
MFRCAVPLREAAGAVELDSVPLSVVEREREDFVRLAMRDQETRRGVEASGEKDDCARRSTHTFIPLCRNSARA